MKLKSRITLYLGIISMLSIVMNLALFPSWNKVQAQEIIQETATNTIEPPVTADDPTIETTVVPSPTFDIFPTDTALPTAVETIIPTDTPSPTITITPSPFATQEIPSGEFTWRVSVEVPIQSAELRSSDGVSGAKAQLENILQTEITDADVTIGVDTTRITNSSATYTVELEGNGGIDQFIQTIYSDLDDRLNLLNGPIQLRITGFVQTGQVVPVILESNITTGYIWELVNYDPLMLEKQGKPVFEQKMSGIGAPSKEMITLRAIADGVTTIMINYHQPFDRSERQTRYIDLSGGLMPDVIDLSNPVQGSANQPDAPITLEAIPQLQEDSPTVSYPATFDWKAQGKVTAVRDQGSCGSCWAFGTVGAMESAILIQSGQQVDLSEQFLVSCNGNNWSCNGGWWAHDYHKNTLANLQSISGAVLESDMPYTASNGTCRTIANHPYKLTNWYSIAGNTIPSVDLIKNAITTHGPVASAICVGPAFSSYRNGVFSTNEASSCPSGVNHAIVLTGWDDTTQSWVLRNSWGAGWGEAGYMRIKWGISNVGYAANYVVYNASSTPTPGGPTPTSTATPQPSTNDDVNNAMPLALINNHFNMSQSITAATSASDDPYFSCVAGRGYKSVWFRFAPSLTGAVTINTNGSGYDTIVGVWQGSRGAFTSAGCNDDISSSVLQSQVTLNVTNGQVYYIEAAGYSSTASGLLNLTLDFTSTTSETSTLTVTMTPTKTSTPSQTSTKTSTPTMTQRPPVGYGTYDDRSLDIQYSGSWVTQKISGNYLNTEKYSRVVGSTAQMTFTGESISVLYRSYPTLFGNMEVRIDGAYVATINQRTPKTIYKNRWSSGNLGAGTHTLTLTHMTGTYVTLDAIIISSPPTATPTASKTSTPTSTRTPTATITARPPVGYGTYDDRSSDIQYTGTWVAQTISSNYLNTEKYSRVVGSTARMTFTGESVSLLYRSYPTLFGNMEVRIDGTYIATINQLTPKIIYKNRWSSGNLGTGTHTLTLTHLTGTYVTLDGIIIGSSPTAVPTAIQGSIIK